MRPLEDPDARYPKSIQQRPDKITVDEKKLYRSHGNLLTSVVNCLLSFELDYGYFVNFSIRSAWKMKSTNIEIAKQLNATGSPKPDIHCMQVRRWWHVRLTRPGTHTSDILIAGEKEGYSDYQPPKCSPVKSGDLLSAYQHRTNLEGQVR